MINPLKYRREHLKLTQDQLATRSGVTRQVVTLAEQGLYIQPPVSLVQTLSDAPGHAQLPSVLRADYLTWVSQKRFENQHLFYKVDLSLADKNPWTCLKNQVAGKSQQGFCRALVYQASLIREFEKFGRGWPSIRNALEAVGVSPTDLNAVEVWNDSRSI